MLELRPDGRCRTEAVSCSLERESVYETLSDLRTPGRGLAKARTALSVRRSLDLIFSWVRSGSKTTFYGPEAPSPTPAVLALEPSEVRFNVTRDARFHE